jgi:urate oxidase
VEQFASGWKRHYYGKGDVIVYRLNRDAKTPSGASPVFGANVLMLVYGDAFWPTYTTGDNTGLVATDSMKNFIQRETLAFEGYDLEGLCRFLAEKFLTTYPRVDGIQVHGFVRDEYTTLPDITNRPLHMWLDLEWSYVDHRHAFNDGRTSAAVREIVRDVFELFESGSIQQVIYRMGTRMLEEIPSLAEVHLEANNRTWDTIAERGDELGVYTDARPPYGCLGLRLKRS